MHNTQKCYCIKNKNKSLNTVMWKHQQQQEQEQFVHKRQEKQNLMAAQQKSAQTTNFIKCGRNSNEELGRGLGHSRIRSNPDFSRRNSSATSVSQYSSTPTLATTMRTPASSPQPNSKLQRQSHVKVLTWGSEPVLPARTSTSLAAKSSLMRYDYTEKRTTYEQQAGGLSISPSRCSITTTTATTPSAERIPAATTSPQPVYAEADIEHIMALQEFRVQHATDCFSADRQNELKLYRSPHFCISGAGSLTEKQLKDTANATMLTPYALRQRLLKLRLQADRVAGNENKRNFNFPPVDSSMALRYN